MATFKDTFLIIPLSLNKVIISLLRKHKREVGASVDCENTRGVYRLKFYDTIPIPIFAI